MGTIKTTNIEPIADNGTVTLGSSGDTFSLGSGVVQSNLMNPAFEANLSANQSVSSNTLTKVQANTESFDTDNCYDNSTNYRFTPTVSGKYYVYFQIRLSWTSSNGDSGVTSIYKNGSEIFTSRINVTSNWYGTMDTFGTVDMNGSSDYLEAFGKFDGGGPIFVSGTSTRFGAYRIGS